MTDLSARIHGALWWLVPLVALAAIIGWETRWGSAFDWHPAPAEPIAPKPVVSSLLPEYAIVGGTGSTEMTQRTLFNPTRRPAPAAVEASAGRLQRGQFALTGTLLIDGKSTAYLREVAGNKPRRVLAGDKINGMLVAEVKPDRVKLTLGDESEELVLKIAANPRPTAPPAGVPTVAAAGTPGTAVVAHPVVPQFGAAPTVPAAAAPSLAERRRAARAAAAEAAGTPQAGNPAAGTADAPAANSPDPRWNQMDQAYRDRVGRAANRQAK